MHYAYGTCQSNLGAVLLIARKLTQKKASLGVVVIITIAALGVAGWLLRENLTQKTSEDAVVLLPVDSVLANAMNYTDDGDIKGGLAFYDSQIKSRKDVNERQQLLRYKSSFALKAGEYQQAIDAAKQAEVVKVTVGTTIALAKAYEDKGDKQQAVQYYRKAIELSPKDDLGSRYNVEWEQKIKELSQ